jgi:hypothetical protein
MKGFLERAEGVAFWTMMLLSLAFTLYSYVIIQTVDWASCVCAHNSWRNFQSCVVSICMATTIERANGESRTYMHASEELLRQVSQVTILNISS